MSKVWQLVLAVVATASVKAKQPEANLNQYDVVLSYHSPVPVISSANPIGYGHSTCDLAFNPSFIPANPPLLNTSGVLVRMCCDTSCHGHGARGLLATDGLPAERIGFAACDVDTGVCGDTLDSSVFNLDSSADSEDPRAFLYNGYYYNFYFYGNSSVDPTHCVGNQCTVKLAKTQTPLLSSSWVSITTLPWHRNGCCIMNPKGKNSYCMFGEGPGNLPGLGISVTTDIDSGVFTQVPWSVAPSVNSPITNDSMWLLPLANGEEIKLEAGTHPVQLSSGDFIHFYASATPGWVANGNYTVGYIILDKYNPTKIIQRSTTHIMIPIFPYETLCSGAPNCTYIGERKNVIFLSSATPTRVANVFRLFFGAGDGNVGTGLIKVSINREME